MWMLPLLPAIWRGERKRYGFGIGYLAGLSFWLINMKWLHTVSGVGAILIALFLATYFGLWGMFAVSVGNPWRKKKDAAIQETECNIQQKIAAKQKKHAEKSMLKTSINESTSSLKFAFINAAAWVGIEWLRGWLFTGFSWNGLGTAFHNTPVLAQAADLIGLTALSFMPVFMSAVLIQTGRRLITEARAGKLRPRLDFSIAALLLAAQFCYGVWRIQQVNSWETQRLRVLLVQENVPQDLKWDPAVALPIMQSYGDSTEAAMQQLEDENLKLVQSNINGATSELKQPDLVIWPESAIAENNYYVKGDDRHFIYGNGRHLIENRIQPLGNFSLILGMNKFEAELQEDQLITLPNGESYNSLTLIEPGEVFEENIQTYGKIHLVLFGEYIPLSAKFPFLNELYEKVSGVPFYSNFYPGQSTEPLISSSSVGEIQLIPSVCFEDSVARVTRKFVRQAPQVIVNITNDGWFLESEAAAQHMANAKFRAIELRRPMIRCANTGMSGIISITGNFNDPVTGKRQIIEDETGNHFVKQTLYGHAYAPKNGNFTLYALAGDWFCYLMIFSVAAVCCRKVFSSSLNRQ